MHIITKDNRVIDIQDQVVYVELNELKFHSPPNSHHIKPVIFENTKKAMAIFSIITEAKEEGIGIIDLNLIEVK